MSFAHTNFPWRVVNAKTCIEYNRKSKGWVHIAMHWKVDSIFWNNNADSKDLINRLNVDIALSRQWPNRVTVFQKLSENKGALFCSAIHAVLPYMLFGTPFYKLWVNIFQLWQCWRLMRWLKLYTLWEITQGVPNSMYNTFQSGVPCFHMKIKQNMFS